MKDGYWLGQDHPGVYFGERQALNEDYTNSGFDRGHLNPNGHHPGCMFFRRVDSRWQYRTGELFLTAAAEDR